MKSHSCRTTSEQDEAQDAVDDREPAAARQLADRRDISWSAVDADGNTVAIHDPELDLRHGRGGGPERFRPFREIEGARARAVKRTPS